MKKVRYKQIYPLLILVSLLGVGIFQGIAQHIRAEIALAERKASPYWEPSEAHGVFCHSEVDMDDSRIHFNVGISHPPGDRELFNETVRRLVRPGPDPSQAWPETQIQHLKIISTICLDRWEDTYQKSYAVQRQMYPFLKDIEHPTEDDYRTAALRVEFEGMGTLDEALEWFPKAAD